MTLEATKTNTTHTPMPAALIPRSKCHYVRRRFDKCADTTATKTLTMREHDGDGDADDDVDNKGKGDGDKDEDK